MSNKTNNTIYAVVDYEDYEGTETLGLFTSAKKAKKARNKFRKLDEWSDYSVRKHKLNELTNTGEFRLARMKERKQSKEREQEKHDSEEYLDAHPWMRHPWPEAPALKFKEGELIMDFSSPTSARIYKEFASVWAKSVDRLAERLGLTKEAAAHKASLHGFAFWAMSAECDARDCGYDVVKYLKDLRCHWKTHFKVEEDAMRYMRIAHTVHIADEMYEESLQIRKWAESFGLQPSDLLV